MLAIQAEIVAEELTVIEQTLDFVKMSRDEARAGFDQVKTNIEECRLILLTIQRREGWRELGYASWREAMEKEFGNSKSTAYRQLAAAVVEDIIADEKATFGEISGAEGELLKRLEDLGATKLVEALEKAEDLAYRNKREKRTISDVHQAVEEILMPGWTSQLFTLQVEGQSFTVNCAIVYDRMSKTVKFTYRGGVDSISEDGNFEEDLEKTEIRGLKSYDSPRLYAHKRLLGLYGIWQSFVKLKARLTKDYPAGSFVKITRDMPGFTGEIGTVALVIGANYNGLCVEAQKLKGPIIIPSGCFSALKVGTEGNPIASMEDVNSVQDFEALIDTVGASVVAIAYVNTSEEVQRKIEYYYPGIQAMVSAEISGVESQNEITTPKPQQLQADIEAVKEMQQQLQEKEAEILNLKAQLQQPLIQTAHIDVVAVELVEEEEEAEEQDEAQSAQREQLMARIQELEIEAVEEELAQSVQIQELMDRIEGLEKQLALRNALTEQVERLQSELEIKEEQTVHPNFAALTETAIAKMEWKSTAYILAGKKLLNQFIELLQA